MRVCCKCGEEIFSGQSSRGSGKYSRHFKPDCQNAKAVPVETPPPLPPEGVMLRPLGPTARMVSSRFAVSEKERQCHTCAEEIRAARLLARLAGQDDPYLEFEEMRMDLILPGDRYERRVYRVPVGESWQKQTRLASQVLPLPAMPYFLRRSGPWMQAQGHQKRAGGETCRLAAHASNTQKTRPELVEGRVFAEIIFYPQERK